MSFFSSRLIGVCVVMWSVTAWSADEAGSSTPLTLRAAIQSAVERNPSLKGFEYRLRAQDARLSSAGQKPAPELALELENAAGSGELRGTQAAETTVSISQVLELGGKRDARLQSGRLEGESLGLDRQVAQLDVIAEVVRRFVHIAADQEQLSLTRQATQLAKNTVDAVKRRVDAAKSPEVELHRANVEYIRAQVELRHAEHELQVSRRKLAAMWGDESPSFGEIEADLYRVPALTSFEELLSRLARNPRVEAFMTQARLRDAQLRLAESSAAPDVTLSAGARRFEESGDAAFVAGVSVPLFAGRRSKPAIAEARALRAQSDSDRDAALIDARTQLYEFYEELRHSIHEVQILRRDALPQMEEALQETQYAYDRGRYSFLELVDGQRAYLDTERAAIEAGLKVQTLVAEIERLTGAPLNEQVSP